MDIYKYGYMDPEKFYGGHKIKNNRYPLPIGDNNILPPLNSVFLDTTIIT